MKKINLCTRGGGVKSGTAIGVLYAFREAGIEISRFSGTSIGAVIMTLAALETPVEEIYRLLKKYVVEYSNASRFQGGKGSAIIESSINEQCNYRKFKDIDKPLYIPANIGGLWNTKAFVFSQETTPDVTVGEACRASCSFPIMYEHYNVQISGEKVKCWDGGMVMNPYIPNKSDNEISVVVSFRKNKANMKSRYVKAWLLPEKQADLLIKPYVGQMGTVGTPDDIELATLLGYRETKKHMKTLKEMLLY